MTPEGEFKWQVGAEIPPEAKAALVTVALELIQLELEDQRQKAREELVIARDRQTAARKLVAT